MPDLIRHYIRQVLIGFAIAGLFVAGLLVFDVMGLWRLVSTVPQGWIALAMLFMANGLVFAGAQFAVSILLMSEEEGNPPGVRRQYAPMAAPRGTAIAKVAGTAATVGALFPRTCVYRWAPGNQAGT